MRQLTNVFLSLPAETAAAGAAAGSSDSSSVAAVVRVVRPSLGGGERRLIGVGELKLRLLGEELFEQLSSTLPLPLHCLSRQVMKRGRTLDERGTRLEVKIAENGCSN